MWVMGIQPCCSPPQPSDVDMHGVPMDVLPISRGPCDGVGRSWWCQGRLVAPAWSHGEERCSVLRCGCSVSEYVFLVRLHPGRKSGPACAQLSLHCGTLFPEGVPGHTPTSGWAFPLGHILVSTWHFLPFHFSHPGRCMAVSHCGFNFLFQ